MHRCTLATLAVCSLFTLRVEAAPSARELWQKANYTFTPQVEAAYLAESKAAALAKIAAAGKKLPADFLAWIDADPLRKTTVYGARQDAAGILLVLRSLEIDLGTARVRGKYSQLALAMAVVHAKDGEKADLAPRAPLVLKITGDPRKLVDTHAKNRSLDLDDHVLNFLNDHAPIIEDVVVGYKEVQPELKYDAHGKAIPRRAAKRKKEPITEKRSRPLRGADVIADAALEKEFNDYMRAHGQTVALHCGVEKRLNWHSHEARGMDAHAIKEAFDLFTHAYKAKGYMPPEREPAATWAESCAYLIRNDEFVMPADKKLTWPKFPLTAPWPLLTMLVDDTQPLRERQDIWERYRDKGEFHGYGEYVGPIAQSSLFLQARRVAPYPFSYGSMQMMLKDGGVCGTMARISVCSHLALGVPASTAGQPGHCAMVRFAYDEATKTYRCQGGQYATAGDAGTGVHVPWFFGDVDQRRPMVYHQSVAWSVNHGLQAYLDTMAAHAFYQKLPAGDRKAHGMRLLAAAIVKSPYNFLLVEDAMQCGAPADLIAFWRTQKTALAAAAARPGCPAEGLYNTTVEAKLFAQIAASPVPADRAATKTVAAFLNAEKCSDAKALALYKTALDGVPALLDETQAALKTHLASVRTPVACQAMADSVSAAASHISDKKERRQWTGGLYREIVGKELYFAKKGHHGKQCALTADPCATTLARLAGQRPRPESEQIQSLLAPLTAQLKAHLAAPRTTAACRELAGDLTQSGEAVAKRFPEAAKKWAEGLRGQIAGKEQYREKGKTLRDPCAEAIAKLLDSTSPRKAKG
jgi:hypothetical protein